MWMMCLLRNCQFGKPSEWKSVDCSWAFYDLKGPHPTVFCTTPHFDNNKITNNVTEATRAFQFFEHQLQ